MPQQISFDPDLMRRYDRNGPRYTSYPAAAQFTTAFDVLAYRRAALLSNADPARPLSAYVHIPFCASPCFYCSCNKIVTRDHALAGEYLARLKTEIALQSALFDARRRLRQLHLGGGTPTYLSMEQLEDLVMHLARHFEPESSDRREYSIEIDPRTLTPITLPRLQALGFNRISLGVQDFDAAVQQAVNRLQSVEQTRVTVEQARSLGFRSINFDLIYGLPRQTIPCFRKTLEEVTRLRPDRIVACDYAHMARLFKAQQAIRENELPSAAVRLQLLQLTVETLMAAGYVYIGLDHFALPEDELAQAQHAGKLHRNFQGYSTHADYDLIGLGVSAVGKFGGCYSQNAKLLPDYYKALDRGALPVKRGVTLTVDDLTRRDLIQHIMCSGAVDFAAVEARYALDFKTYFARELSELRPMLRDGLLSELDDRLIVSPKGRLLLRNVAMVFDAYLQISHASGYSRAI